MAELEQFGAALAVLSDAVGAWPHGTRVAKTNSEPSDKHRDGSLGTILGSLGPIPWEGRQTWGYCLIWDDMPGVPVWTKSTRLEQVKE